MAFNDIDSRQAVLDAIAEFDKMGRSRFLEHYGFGEARGYRIQLDGKIYDSKAIVGVAHKYQFPNEGPLKPRDFSGGAATVQRKLEKMGFHVESPSLKP